ncbi:hypothetical protein [Novosphingobium sp.]|uniref:hypothetical protein n=1 Tax=Novosphingobium sp. TaxID=1874826 RepID=UPI0028AE1BCC|nr:hypothetical protein [Novosphingobium sp.]
MRANHKPAEIANAMSVIAWINQSIFIADDFDILASIQLLHDNYGHSLALARKLAFILGYLDKDTESWKTASKMFASYGVNARNYGMMAVADSIGREFSYLDVKSGFQNFSDYKSGSSASRKLAYLSFKPITFSPDEVLDGIAASYSFSLIDAIIYILSHRELGVIDGIRFDQIIEDAWASLQIDSHRFELFFVSDSEFGDLHAFRAAPAFLEYGAFRNFRAATQDLYDTADVRSKKIIAANPFQEDFYQSVSSIKDLLPSRPQAFDSLPQQFDRITSGSLARSCGLSLVATQTPDFSNISREEMGSLMGQTTDVDRLLAQVEQCWQNMRGASGVK